MAGGWLSYEISYVHTACEFILSTGAIYSVFMLKMRIYT